MSIKNNKNAIELLSFILSLIDNDDFAELPLAIELIKEMGLVSLTIRG